MNKIKSFLAVGILIGGSGITASAQEVNQLTDEEKAEGWHLLFDGTSTAGWKGYKRDDAPGTWNVVDGNLFMNGSGRDRDRGDLLFAQQFADFHLKLEWKISEGGNSGIFYRGIEAPELDVIYKSAPEMQVLDNNRHPDAKMGRDGNRTAGSLYDLIPPRPQNVRPVGEWNSAEIRVENGQVQHYQNGELVLEFQLDTQAWRDLVAGSKFPGLNRNWVDVPARGYIGLQDHNDDVWYRSVKIREL
ncbi:MAG: glycosyl hydrolase [Gammaproteobacteria bacterium]|nr:glycosyl hydrolase [Gammaproteobacteria bacterium]|tara:strand:+ start:2778 stop:3512 length:735 start_codon:yes stop_codon:yes gene_type:complete